MRLDIGYVRSTLRLGSQGSGCESCMCGFRLLSTYLRVRVLGLGGVCLVCLDLCLLSIYLRDRVLGLGVLVLYVWI